MFLKLRILVTLIFFSISSIIALEPSDLVFIILSQEESYNAAQAQLLETDLIKQSSVLDKVPHKIILTHDLDVFGSWTIVPLIPYLASINVTAQWYVFCTENTVVRLSKLLKALGQYDVDIYRNLWVGHSLYDKEPTIIHHFAEHSKKFKYPNLQSGFAISKHLFNSLVKKAGDGTVNSIDFSVDVSYEFSKFVFNESKSARLTHLPAFCIVATEDCATYPRPFYPCDKLSAKQNVYVAVKTCTKFHKERLDIIRKLWIRHAEHAGFFTDQLDENLRDGIVVPKTDQGHCAKTFAILKYVAPILDERKLDWLLIVDDDTILSLSRLFQLLTCYNPENSVAIGERYGYRATKIHGYDYLTGGAGVVLSTALVHKIIKPGVCNCPVETTPDDMFLFGVCLAHLGVKVTNSPLFHQARPSDYAEAYLASQEPISFHKFWMIEPEEVYEQWFEDADLVMFSKNKARKRIEL
ncbi:beta-1,3-glucosyltransferase [Copidosoma floridanum]|uniref:beta-1,3-glucosyltransferase n=1 Tax=Copidosoma floridanum TaxID=29053 RepID=UPI0006C9AE0E|nr:beta-1,3-glucosyltransferase [Copidosoma floridanum]